MGLLFDVVRATVFVGCLLPCVSAGFLAARREVTRECTPSRFVPTSSEGKGSSVVVARFGTKNIAFVADTDEQAIVAFDTANGRSVGREPVSGSPSAMLMTDDGRLFVAARDANVVRLFEPRAESVACSEGPLLRPIAELSTASEPVALAAGKETLLVASGWGHTVEAFSTKSHQRTFSTSVPREPRAIVITPDGRRAFVSHATGPLSVIDLEGDHRARNLAFETRDVVPREIRTKETTLGAFDIGVFSELPNPFGIDDLPKPAALSRTPRAQTQGFALASFEGYILAPEVLVQPGEMPEPTKRKAPEPRPTGYGSFGGLSGIPRLGTATAHVAVVSAASEAIQSESIQLDVDDRTCLLPRAAAIDPERQSLLVTCLGTNEIDEYDARSASPTKALLGRWTVPAGPTGIAVFDERIAVWSSFDRILTVIHRYDELVVHASTTPEREPTPFEVGRKIFHASTDRALSSDGRACASCHPDGRDDGLTWTSPDGPRQTPMLAGRLADTAPFGWTGESNTVREHLRLTFARLEGRGLNDKQTYALLTYLAKMKTPARTPPRDANAVARGREIFDSYETGCSSCHRLKDGKPIGDGDIHDVGSKARGDRKTELATPSLQFVGGTGPYFHDGRYATLDDLLRKTDGQMGSTSHLSAADREALTSFLESL
jgi:hypothetical protein